MRIFGQMILHTILVSFVRLAMDYKTAWFLFYPKNIDVIWWKKAFTSIVYVYDINDYFKLIMEFRCDNIDKYCFSTPNDK